MFVQVAITDFVAARRLAARRLSSGTVVEFDVAVASIDNVAAIESTVDSSPARFKIELGRLTC